ncbi:MAG: MBL fold metallo-hydrolase [Deinococcales bacterium]
MLPLGYLPWSTADGDFIVLHAPGHSHDMTVLYDPARRAIFSADLYLSSKQRLMRRDEVFEVTLESLKRVLRLDIDMLLCGHPVFHEGKARLGKTYPHAKTKISLKPRKPRLPKPQKTHRPRRLGL